MFVRFAIWPIALVLLIASPDFARADNDYARIGPYVGFAYSRGFEVVRGDERLLGGSFSIVDSTNGFTAVAGYRLTPFWAVEIDLEYMNAFSLVADPPLEIPPPSARTLSTTLNFNFYPFEGRDGGWSVPFSGPRCHKHD